MDESCQQTLLCHRLPTLCYFLESLQVATWLVDVNGELLP